MAYRLRSCESVGNGVRRIAREQIDKSVAELTDSDIGRHVAVHQFRKRGKKIRGLIRLVRPALGSVYKRENAWYRDAARGLSQVRDAEALLETLDRIRDHFSEELDDDTFLDLRRRLQQRRRRMANDRLGLDETIDQLPAELEAARRRIDDWQIDDAAFDAVHGGLIRTYRRACTSLSKVSEKPSDERWHEWRKRTKYHWYQMRLLTGVWKPVLKARTNELKRLADLLGDDRDLAVFRKTIRDDASLRPERPEVIELMMGLMHSERKRLQQDAEDLGRRVFAEPPKRFVRRIESYWSVWRRE